MSVTIKRVDGFRVSTPGGVKAKSTTKAKAKKQKRLLQAVEHGFKPTGKKKGNPHPETPNQRLARRMTS